MFSPCTRLKIKTRVLLHCYAILWHSRKLQFVSFGKNKWQKFCGFLYRNDNFSARMFFGATVGCRKRKMQTECTLCEWVFCFTPFTMTMSPSQWCCWCSVGSSRLSCLLLLSSSFSISSAPESKQKQRNQNFALQRNLVFYDEEWSCDYSDGCGFGESILLLLFYLEKVPFYEDML